MVIAEDDVAKAEDLILNISIEDLVNDMVEDNPMWYNEVLQFIKKILCYRSCTSHSPIVFSVMWMLFVLIIYFFIYYPCVVVRWKDSPV